MRVKNRKRKGKKEKYASQPGRCFGQNGGRLCAENVFRHATAERRPQALAFRPLHENDKKHQQRDQYVNSKDDINENVHFRGWPIWPKPAVCKRRPLLSFFLVPPLLLLLLLIELVQITMASRSKRKSKSIVRHV